MPVNFKTKDDLLAVLQSQENTINELKEQLKTKQTNDEDKDKQDDPKDDTDDFSSLFE